LRGDIEFTELAAVKTSRNRDRREERGERKEEKERRGYGNGQKDIKTQQSNINVLIKSSLPELS